MIVSTSRKTSGNDYRKKALNPNPRGLLKAIKRAMEMTKHALRSIIPCQWVHVDLLTQLTIKKDVLDLKLEDRPIDA